MLNLVKVLLLLIFFLIPLVPPFGNFGYEQAKVEIFRYLVIASSLIWLVWLIKNQAKINLKKDMLFIAATLFIISLSITSLIGIDLGRSLFGDYPYYQGLITYLCLYLLYLIASSVKISFNKWSIAWITSSTIVALWAIREGIKLFLMHLPVASYNGRIVSTFGQPDIYSGLLLISFPLLLTLPKGKFYQTVHIVLGLTYALAIYFSQSRTAIFLLLTWIVFLLITKLSGQLKWIVFAGSFCITVFAVYLSITTSSGFIWNEFIAPQSNQWLIDNSPENRIYIWQIVGQIVLQKPLTGYGLENLSAKYHSYLQTPQKYPAYFGLKNLSVNRAHNYPLDLLFSGGIITFLLWLFLLIKLLKQTKNHTLLYSLALYLLWIQFQNQSIVQLIYFWSCLGLIENFRLTNN